MTDDYTKAEGIDLSEAEARVIACGDDLPALTGGHPIVQRLEEQLVLPENRKMRRAAYAMARRRGVSHQNLPKTKRKFRSDGVTRRAERVLSGYALISGLMKRIQP